MMFQFKDNLAGSLKSVTPSAARPGTPLTFRGSNWDEAITKWRNVFIGGNSQNVVCLAGRHGLEPEDNMNIRVSKTTGSFDRDVEASNIYGANTYRCSIPEDLLAGGSYSVNLLMGAGAASLPATSLNTDASGTEYHHQVVADAYSLTPVTGSKAGGTRITITGDGFSQERRNNTVLIRYGPLLCCSSSPLL
jgi:hypothetical protein